MNPRLSSKFSTETVRDGSGSGRYVAINDLVQSASDQRQRQHLSILVALLKRLPGANGEFEAILMACFLCTGHPPPMLYDHSRGQWCLLSVLS